VSADERLAPALRRFGRSRLTELAEPERRHQGKGGGEGMTSITVHDQLSVGTDAVMSSS